MRIKLPHDIDGTRGARKVAELGLEEFHTAIRPGISEAEVASRVEGAVHSQTGVGCAFAKARATIQSGINTVDAGRFSRSTGKKINPFEPVLLEMAVCVDGFWCDLTRMTWAGEPPSRDLELLDVVVKAQELAIRAMLPGVRAAEVDRLVLTFLREASLDQNFTHATGHHTGFRYHDEGDGISRSSRETLEGGMVLTVEPGVYGEALGLGVRVEDNISSSLLRAPSVSKFSLFALIDNLLKLYDNHTAVEVLMSDVSLNGNAVKATVALGAVISVLGLAGLASAQTVTVVQTTADQSNLLAYQASATFGTGGAGSYTLNVNDNNLYQSWDGVGAAMTDSSNWLIEDQLTSSQRSQLLQDLFSPSGVGFDLVRMPMGASDFSASGDYSYDDGSADPNLYNFSVNHDTPSTIPVAQQAFQVNPYIKIFALPWSPPAWMKTSGTMNGGNFQTQNWQSLADYFVDFVQAYQAQGLPIYAITPQNEPLNSTGGYPSEYLAATDEANFIANYLGPTMNTAGLGNVKIVAYDHNWDTPSYPETVINNGGGYVAGTAWHCYSSTDGEGAERQIWNEFPNQAMWLTECTGTLGSNFGGDLGWYAQHLLITNVRNGGQGVILWNIALDQNGGPTNGGCSNCRGVVTINTSSSPAGVQPNVEYYALGQVGKFVRPGARVMATDSQGGEGIQSTGWKNPDNSKVLLVYNGLSYGTTITVNWDGASTFDYYLPSGALTTFDWN